MPKILRKYVQWGTSNIVAEVERSLPKLYYYSPVILECLGYCCNIFDKVLYFDESVKVLCDPQLLFPYSKTRGLFRALLNICDGVHFPKKVFGFYFRKKPLSWIFDKVLNMSLNTSQLTFTCSKSTIERLEKSCEICSKLTIKAPGCHWRCSGVFIITLNIFHTFF